MIKSTFIYAGAVLIVFGAYFSTPITASAATYLIDLSGNGCGSQCAELQEYLNSLNSNSNSNSSSTSSTDANGSGDQATVPTYPNLQYQYSSSTLAYYQRNQQPTTSNLYAYPTYSYFANPAGAYPSSYPGTAYPSGAAYPAQNQYNPYGQYNQYGSTGYVPYPSLQYVYNNGKVAGPSTSTYAAPNYAAELYMLGRYPSYGAPTYGTQSQQPYPYYGTQAYNAPFSMQPSGFVMTSGK